MNPAELPLHDIHVPSAPGWWPPAPGWWIAAALLVIVFAAFLWWRRHRRLSAADAARAEIARLRLATPTIEPARLAQELSALLRRAAISFHPRAEAAALTGDHWLRFLDQALPEQPFSRGPGRLIAELPYRRSVSAEETAPLLDLCARWVEAAARRPRVQR